MKITLQVLSWSPEWDEKSAWAGHMPFAYWLMGEILPKVLVKLGRN
jgi:hypothetical protein